MGEPKILGSIQRLPKIWISVIPKIGTVTVDYDSSMYEVKSLENLVKKGRKTD